MLHGKPRLHGKHSQTLSVRELEARESEQLEVQWDAVRSSASPETLFQMRQRTRREGRARLRLWFQLEGQQYLLSRPTLGLPVRLIYFLFIGLWFGFVWLALGVALCLSLIGLPLGVWMLRHLDKAFALW